MASYDYISWNLYPWRCINIWRFWDGQKIWICALFNDYIFTIDIDIDTIRKFFFFFLWKYQYPKKKTITHFELTRYILYSQVKTKTATLAAMSSPARFSQNQLSPSPPSSPRNINPSFWRIWRIERVFFRLFFRSGERLFR